MESLLVMAMLGGAVLSQASATPATPAEASVSASSVKTEGASHLTDVPPLPKGKSTVLGGAIREVDPVRDRMVLNVYGEKPMKILYDERTQVFRNGKRVPLHDLGPSAHASVQTTLDGAKVFAVTVHILSDQPTGDYEGRVTSFDRDKGILTLTSAASRVPFQVLVTNQTSFKREGQAKFASQQSSANDLLPGSLVTVQFASNNKGQGAATEISVLAAPGATFVFGGTVSALDMHTGSLTLLDAKTNQPYQISFDPARQAGTNLRLGQRVRVSAEYDGTRYVATDISVQ